MRTLMLICLVTFFPPRLLGDGQASIRVPLLDGRGQNVGSVLLIQTNHSLQVTIRLKNVPPGEHAVHVHEGATCGRPDFSSAGAHFNPTGKEHGFANVVGHHAGDFQTSVMVGPDQRGERTFIVKYLSFFGTTPVIGHTIVVHARSDDQTTDPDGNSGDRLACGEILTSLKKYGDL